MKTFSFYINADRCTYSFVVKNGFEYGREVVILDAKDSMRHPDFQHSGNGIISAHEDMIPVEDFQNDLNNFVNRLNKLRRPIEGHHIAEVLEDICEEHIGKYGRLIFYDLLTYADLYIKINSAIFESPIHIYQDIYKCAIYRILDKFAEHVVVQSPLGMIPYTAASRIFK